MTYQQCHGTSLNGRALAYRPQALGGFGLDVELARLQLKRLGNALAHQRNVRCQARRLGNDGAVQIAHVPARSAHAAQCFYQ